MITPPLPPKKPHDLTQWGLTRQDPWFWLQDPRWAEVLRDPAVLDPEIRTVLEAEAAYAEAVLAPAADLRKALFDEMRARLPEADLPPPVGRGPWLYGHRFDAGADRPVFYRRPRGEGDDQVLLDAQVRGADFAYYDVGWTGPSPDHRSWAWAEDRLGSEVHTLRAVDLATGQELGPPIEGAAAQAAWSADGVWLFWVEVDDQARPQRVKRRRAAGGPVTVVYDEADPGFFVRLGTTADGAWLVIGAENHETSEHWLLPTDQPEGAPACVWHRRPGTLVSLDRQDQVWVLRTNLEAEDFRLARSRAAVPTFDTWEPWVDHRPGTALEHLVLVPGWAVTLERADASPRLVARPLAGGQARVLEGLGDLGAWSLGGHQDDAFSVVRAVWSSPSVPRKTFDFDLAAGKRTLVADQPIPSGHDPDLYQVGRLEALAPDGARVPVTFLARRETPADGSAPVLLTGYGAYGYATEARFTSVYLSLADRGWVVALAHVRGGSDRGRRWFLEGRGALKKNSFTDFVAAAEGLAAAGWGRPGRYVAFGGSAGGLLVAAALNLRPDLWGAVLAAVPFVDVLTTMGNPDLPLTPPEWPEWGNPLTDRQAYDTIAAYSPYDNVARAAYPPVLATAGLTDPRVTYWEPAKWIARLRDQSTSGAPQVLAIDLTSGHGGGSGRFDQLKEFALLFTFALEALK